MVTPKYDINKTFKLSNQNIANILKIQDKKGCRNDSEVVRFALDFVSVVMDRELETATIAKVIETMANDSRKG